MSRSDCLPRWQSEPSLLGVWLPLRLSCQEFHFKMFVMRQAGSHCTHLWGFTTWAWALHRGQHSGHCDPKRKNRGADSSGHDWSRTDDLHQDFNDLKLKGNASVTTVTVVPLRGNEMLCRPAILPACQSATYFTLFEASVALLGHAPQFPGSRHTLTSCQIIGQISHVHHGAIMQSAPTASINAASHSLFRKPLK